MLINTCEALGKQIDDLDAEIGRRAKDDPIARRLMTIPGIGPIAATAIIALVPAPEGFRAGRDFAAWPGLTPLQKQLKSGPPPGCRERDGPNSRLGDLTEGTFPSGQAAERPCHHAGSSGSGVQSRGCNRLFAPARLAGGGAKPWGSRPGSTAGAERLAAIGLRYCINTHLDLQGISAPPTLAQAVGQPTVSNRTGDLGSSICL
jgi:hypothetical protein